MNFGAIINLFKQRPFLTTFGVGSVGLGGLKTIEDSKSNQTPASNQQTKQQATAPSKQPTQQSKQPTQTSAPSKQSQEPPPLPLPPPTGMPNATGLLPPPPPIGGSSGSSSGNNAPAPVEDDDFKELQKQFYGLFSELDKYRQEYDAVVEKHMQVNDLYEKQLLASMSAMSLLLSKTPLNNMTNEDLIHHATNLFTSMPYGNALENFSKLTKGYYLAKMNNVNPSELSTTDLIAIADNPVLAKSADENLAGYLEQIGEVLKLKMKSNLDEIGNLKEAFSNYKKELEEKGKLLKDLIDLKKVEFTLGINQYKAEEMTRHHQATEETQKERNVIDLQKLAEKTKTDEERTKLKEKEIQLKEQTKGQKSKKDEDNNNTPSF